MDKQLAGITSSQQSNADEHDADVVPMNGSILSIYDGRLDLTKLDDCEDEDPFLVNGTIITTVDYPELNTPKLDIHTKDTMLINNTFAKTTPMSDTVEGTDNLVTASLPTSDSSENTPTIERINETTPILLDTETTILPQITETTPLTVDLNPEDPPMPDILQGNTITEVTEPSETTPLRVIDVCNLPLQPPPPPPTYKPLAPQIRQNAVYRRQKRRPASETTYVSSEDEEVKLQRRQSTNSAPPNDSPGQRYRRHRNNSKRNSYHYRRNYQRQKSAPNGTIDEHIHPDMKEQGVLEANLRRLQQIQSDLQKLRTLRTDHDPQRYSSSCPSIPKLLPGAKSNHRQVTQLAMTPLIILPARTPTTTSLTDMRSSAASRGEGSSDVTIYINDVTLDSADDGNNTSGSGSGGHKGSSGVHTLSVGGVDSDSECDEMSIEYQKRQRRRSSWCPEEGRKVEEKKEQKRMLNVTGRSQSLSSLDGQDDEDDSDSADNISISSMDGRDAVGPSSPGHTSLSMAAACTMEAVANDETQKGGMSLNVTNNSKSSSGTQQSNRRASTKKKKITLSAPSKPKKNIPSKKTAAPPIITPTAVNGSLNLVPASMQTPVPPPRTPSPLTLSFTPPRTPPNMGSTDSITTPPIVTSQESVVTTPPAQRSLSDVQLNSKKKGGDGSLDTMSPHGSSPQMVDASSGLSLLVPHSNLMKSISTPAIPSMSDAHTSKGSGSNHNDHVSAALNKQHSSPSSTQSHDDDVDEDELLNALLRNDKMRKKHRVSMVEFLNDPSNFADDDPDRPKHKEEKKRRSSVFSKLGSYRQKKLGKPKSTHQFVSVSFSNSTACDMCLKSMANKAALQCENCMINVHENYCKDQIAPCTRVRVPKVQRRDSVKDKMSKVSVGANSHLRNSNSFRETRRAISIPDRNRQSSQSSSPKQNQTPGKVIEERDVTVPREITQHHSPVSYHPSPASRHASPVTTPRHTPEPHIPPGSQLVIEHYASINDSLSVSIESLDEGTGDVNDTDEDPELSWRGQEPEAWSVTVDKKTLKKMAAKEIKRQDHIWELIQTEKSHCRTLRIMHKIFSRGMLDEVHMSSDMVDRIFPCIPELLDIHTVFLHSLLERQQLRVDKLIDEVGDLLVQQFEGELGDRMRIAYGKFCSRHNEAVQLYKDLHKSDRKFQNFIKKCSQNNLCKRLGIPECILLVTQRMTKYPLLIEPIMKTTKENRLDFERLNQALILTRNVLNYIDCQVDAHAKEQRVIEIYNKLDARSCAMYKGKKFKKSDLLSANHKLLYEGFIKWMSARGKTFEVLCVIMCDLIFFLNESNGKYSFFTQDNKSSVVGLSNLLVREKGDTRDSKGLYLICQSKTEPEMYELVCRSSEDRRAWIRTLRLAIMKCPEEETIEGKSETEEEKKLLEAKCTRLRQIIDQLHQKDHLIRACCEDKMRCILDMLEIFGREEAGQNLKTLYKDEEGLELKEPHDILRAVVQEGSRLAILLQSSEMLANNPQAILLGRSISSVGERQSSTFSVQPLPKRAETFSGFDDKERASLKKRHMSQQPMKHQRGSKTPPARRAPSPPTLPLQCNTPNRTPSPVRHGQALVHNPGLPSQPPSISTSTSPQPHHPQGRTTPSPLSFVSPPTSTPGGGTSAYGGGAGGGASGDGATESGAETPIKETDVDSLLTADISPARMVELRRGSVGVIAAVQEFANKVNNNKMAMSRRMSTSFLQNILIKQQSEQADSVPGMEDTYDQLAPPGGPAQPAVVASPMPLVTPTQEQCSSLVQLMQYVHSLVGTVSQQTTEVESLRNQLIEANSKITHLYSEAERLGKDRKNPYHHVKQLEELKTLQEQINGERSSWEQTKEKEREKNRAKEMQLQSAQDAIKKEQEALKAKQNELQRQKDALQRQMDMHHEQTMTRSPSHNAQHDPDYKNDGKTAPPSSVPQTVWDHVAHKRSASDELQRGIEEPVQLLSTEQAMSLKEPLHLNHQNQTAYSGSSVGNISAFVSGHDVSGNHLEGKSPIHLAMSVTNERRQQQTTLKPTQSASVSGPGAMGIKRNASYAATSSSGTSVQQMLPYHLSGKDRSSHTTSNPSIASANQSPDHHGMSRHSSASSVRAESPDRLQNQHPSTKITRSNTQITNKQSVKQQLSLQNQRSSHSSSMLPMQLAEKEKKRPRSASANLGNSGTQQRNASSLPSSRTSSVSAQDRVLLHYYKPGLKNVTGRHSAPSGPVTNHNSTSSGGHAPAGSVGGHVSTAQQRVEATIADHLQRGPHHQPHHQAYNHHTQYQQHQAKQPSAHHQIYQGSNNNSSPHHHPHHHPHHQHTSDHPPAAHTANNHSNHNPPHNEHEIVFL